MMQSVKVAADGEHPSGKTDFLVVFMLLEASIGFENYFEIVGIADNVEKKWSEPDFGGFF